MRDVALRVKNNSATPDEIENLVNFTKENGGIEYAEKKMLELKEEAMQFIVDYVSDDSIRKSLSFYLDYVIQRSN